MNTPRLETDRLILRKFTENDLNALFKIFSDIEVNTFLPWFPLKSIEETKDFYDERYAKAYLQPCGYRYAVCLKEDNIPVGYVNISTEVGHDLGYGLLKNLWHKGIVREACSAVVEQVKKDGMSYITATHDIDNIRSGNVMKALGMNYMYSYVELWQPKNFLVTFRMYQLNFDNNYEVVYKEYWTKYKNHFIENI